MKLQQLRYALEVYRHNLNVSEAADALFTSQPGVSKQIRLLEDELGIQIFIRSGKRIVSVSQPGKSVLQMAERILHDIQNIKNIGREFSGQDNGTLTIATTHTQARYVLPDVVAAFMQRYPKVRLNIRQSDPEGIVQMLHEDGADVAVLNELPASCGDLRRLPCKRWVYGLVMPEDHPLLDNMGLSWEALLRYTLITYESAFTPGSSSARAFGRAGVSRDDIALFAADADVLKAYVRRGLGIGVVEKMAFSPESDQGLVMVDAAKLFEPADTSVLLRQDTYLRGYIYDFLELFSPELTRSHIDHLLYAPAVEDFSI
ncbi:LysR substrate-binding domain-containing protein [Neisseria leonii]|uniref:LysR substrate-binding domain-containing protein n=1 Tax=Neisseria leonii TaxID=2995413 RepID=A0A9X4E777_9NEIS|nr:LysR substrate-binding domain-containing protein [Neisseria sp. 51.81]MDD9328397.1 LysR substrate-binding domain-containing protein [Neisseria sp. 51.81]